MVGCESSVSDAHLTCIDDEESDLGSVKSGAVVLGGPGEAQMRSHVSRICLLMLGAVCLTCMKTVSCTAEFALDETLTYRRQQYLQQ